MKQVIAINKCGSEMNMDVIRLKAIPDHTVSSDTKRWNTIFSKFIGYL